LAGALLGVGGIALAVSAGAPPPTPLLLGTSTALLGALLCPLAVGGLLLEGRWLWRGAIVESWCIGCAAVLVGAAGAFLPVALVSVVAAAASGAGARMVGVIAALTLVGAALALVAGSVVPLRGGGAGDQLTTFAVFAAFAVAASLVIGLAGPRLVAIGLPDPVVVLLVCAAATGAALGSVGLRINGAAR
jgi:hypothetical protein